MASGLFALLDDVAAIAKVAAASIDDVGKMAAATLDDTAAAAVKASAKAAGVVVDDAAVTPRYVVGFSADRELPIVARIARGSLRNKLLILLPVALALSAFLPVLITPLLMAGGAFLCFEGAEKLWEKLRPHAEAKSEDGSLSAVERENSMVAGAIRTDLILSAEIMAIALGTVEQEPLMEKAAALIAVALGITGLVYGAVALIVKADDLGVRLARQSNGAVAAIGRGLVSGMPGFLALLGWVGLAAMLWVGGHIVIDGLNKFGVSLPHELLHGLMHAVEDAGGLATWLAEAGGSGLFGLVLGGLIVAGLHAIPRKAH
jgi:predicted DNA repair protein MutK